MCRISFRYLDNYNFRKFVSALNPAFAKVMLCSHWLRPTGLDGFYMEAVGDTEKAMSRIPGKTHDCALSHLHLHEPLSIHEG